MPDMLESGALMATAESCGPAVRDAPSLENGDLDLRQLRHHTKNALQRIHALVASSPGLRGTEEGRQLLAEIEGRIRLAAQVSDALFGLTRAPASLETRLRLLAEGLAELLADVDQVIHVDVSCAGTCSPALQRVVLSAAQELVGNAVKHGFHARLVGRISVHLSAGPRGIKLVVADDGWGLGHKSSDGQGLNLVRAFIAPFGGTLALQSADGVTAEVLLPSIVLNARFTAPVGQRGREAA